MAIGTRIPLGGPIEIIPSARIRYAHMSIDRYAETGAFDSLSVKSRDVSLWQGRAQIAAQLAVNGFVKFLPRIGVEGWTSDNDKVSAVLIGQAITFVPGGKDNEVRGSVGGTISGDLGGGFSLFADGEIHAGEDGIGVAQRVEGRAGIKVVF